ncbi:MAG: WG repeat-containing protein [Melioribacteraceae bacterium]|nr:WG repeat-containing protein [Melioribacteraceae bacterium]
MKTYKKYANDKYQYLGFLPSSVRIKENGFWGMNDFEGNEILPSNFIEVFTLSSGYGLIAARDAGFWDIYDYSGKRLNNVRFDFIYPYYGFFGMTKVKKGKKWGLINKYGKTVVPIKYDIIEKFGKGILLRKESDIEFIDRDELINLTHVRGELSITRERTSIPIRNVKIHSKQSTHS